MASKNFKLTQSIVGENGEFAGIRLQKKPV
jgi:hypothetical protein